MAAKNTHACAVKIGSTGILITGPSGSGKTSVALGLLERAQISGFKSVLVADDQVYLENRHEKLIASVPEAIGGMVELRGFGIVSLPHELQTEIGLVVKLIEDERLERLPEQKFISIKNISVPVIKVPQRHENHAVRIVFAWLTANSGLQVFTKSPT